MNNRIIVAADELSLSECLKLTSLIGDRVDAIKIHNLYDSEGPGVVKRILAKGSWHAGKTT